jgi:cob(I)alamin adenosyltransferase
MKIYTRKGDAGQTSLLNGQIVPKSNMRICAYGDVDELNSFIGLAITAVDKELSDVLTSIQIDLFAIGAQLADPLYEEKKKKDKTIIGEESITRFEKLIDKYEEELEPLRSFILPGGGKKAAMLHILRTVSRRAERSVVNLVSTGEKVPEIIIKYLNRLSDLFFVMARLQNKRDGCQDVKWT